MNRFFYIFIFFQHFLFSQTINNAVYVEYECKIAFMVSEALLIADNNHALYVKGSKDINNNDEIEQDDNGYFKVLPKTIKTNTIEIYSNNSSDTFIKSFNPRKDKTTVSLDNVPKINWTLISGETKEIRGILCHKAKTIFRGSEIVAYYTLEIPIPFGPFKFKGLPGLILEVISINSAHEYKWTIKTIKYPYSYSKSFNFDKQKYNDEIVSYKSLVVNFDKKLDEANKKMRAKSQLRGGSLISKKRERVSIEQVYEWEK
jgi:GLPGLI family protein